MSISNDLSPEQEDELDKRLRQYESGKMTFSSWEDAKKRIVSRNRNFTVLDVRNKDFVFNRDEANER